MNRIISAIDNTGHYNLQNVTYDKMGNILTLNRNGYQGGSVFNDMDKLVYTYNNGNQLIKLLDNGNDNYGFKDRANLTTEYTYDANGNLTKNLNKDITSVSYNHLNMPTEIKLNNSDTQKVRFVYAANGTKLRKIKNENGSETITDYAGNYIYENGDLKQFYHSEGYVEPNGSNFDYIYQYKDIWRNVRLTYADTNNDGAVTQNEIRQERNYYPFGLQHIGYNNAKIGVISNFKTYQGQEFNEDLGLNLHEWKYRFSDPAEGRFWQIDPLSESYLYNSTYAFAENKLGMGVELEGLEMITFGQLPPVNTPLLGVSDAIILSDGGKILNTGRVGRPSITETVGRTTETAARLSRNQKRGAATEATQLAKEGLSKNTEKFTRIDPKTGKEGTTIPDGVKPNGGTVEIKNVQKQSLTRQLRLQQEVSKGSGVKPELIINKGAKLSKPLQNAGFDIKTYQVIPGVKKDNTNIPLKKSKTLPTKKVEELPILTINGKPVQG
ncbi:putative toxin [Tenacibaculum ascidiaceicola]|uniref:putative toxin n=1 Tax=Tenacibaculum ascidiaceicola TaxID=1699411 RepID=UPI003893A85F